MTEISEAAKSIAAIRCPDMTDGMRCESRRKGLCTGVFCHEHAVDIQQAIDEANAENDIELTQQGIDIVCLERQIAEKDKEIERLKSECLRMEIGLSAILHCADAPNPAGALCTVIEIASKAQTGGEE